MHSIVFFLAILICVVSFGLNAQVVSTQPVPTNLTPVTTLSLTAFLGRWYMMYASMIPKSTFLKDAYCVVDDTYSVNSNNVADLNYVSFNDRLSFNQGSPTGPLVQLNSVSTNAHFLTAPGAWMLSTDQKIYYILALGEPAITSCPDLLAEGVGAHYSTEQLPTDAPLQTKIGNQKVIRPLPTDTIPPHIGNEQPQTSIDSSVMQYTWAIGADADGTELFVYARCASEFKLKYEEIVLQKVQSFGFAVPLPIVHTSDCMYPAEISSI